MPPWPLPRRLTEVPRRGTAPAEVLTWWESLSVAAQAKMLATYPELLGNLDGMPYEVRIAANRINITNAIEASAAREPGLRAERDTAEARIAELQTADPMEQADMLEMTELQARVDELSEQILQGVKERNFCRSLLEYSSVGFDAEGRQISVPGHQVVLFDPEHGRFAEVVGTIGPRTRNIGVLIPGTGANLLNMDGQYERAEAFVLDEDFVNPPGSLAVISYLPGPMPQTVAFEAFDTSFALNQAQEVASFVNAIDNPGGATVTVIGHSYGGSVVGAAEVAGMHADRILHVESAGSGPEVHSINDYAYPDTDRYTMTAPNDPIMYAQGATVGPLGHGVDPATLDGAVRLETGLRNADNPELGILEGGYAHSGVFDVDSTAYRNMLAVMTGGEASLYNPAAEEWVQVEENGQIVNHLQYPMEDRSYDPPTLDVP